MKKYIVILLSFGLFSLPLGTFARSTAEFCNAYPGDNCPIGCYNERGSSEETCTPCPAGTYTNETATVYKCKPCSKPTGATFRENDTSFQGMTRSDECPWYITCPENQEIYHNWGNATTCSNCSKGYYKTTDTTQYWDGTTMTGDCQPKTFTINARILLPENCGAFTGTASITFTYTTSNNITLSFTNIKEALKSIIDTTKYDYPKPGTKFTLDPINTEGPTVDLVLDQTGDHIVFANALQNGGDFDDIIFYPDGQEFNMDVTLVEKNPIRVYYCPSQFTNSGAQSGICKATTYNKCNKPMAPDLSDNSIFNVGSPDCSKGQYANSWKLLHPSNLYSYNWAASNNPVINFGDTIILPSDTNSTYFYMAPNFTDCPSGTYNDNVTCPTNCEPCPDGFTSDTGAASKTDCYINTTMTFKDNNNKSVTILSSPVYYVGNQ